MAATPNGSTVRSVAVPAAASIIRRSPAKEIDDELVVPAIKLSTFGVRTNNEQAWLPSSQ
jgi:hypothetical protein